MNQSPNPSWKDIDITVSKPKQDSGTVLFSRRSATGEFEQRTIRVRYGGRSVLTIALTIATMVLLILGKTDWSTLTAIADAVVVSSIMDRYRRDLRWITGYTSK
jgi:hypothetical protein